MTIITKNIKRFVSLFLICIIVFAANSAFASSWKAWQKKQYNKITYIMLEDGSLSVFSVNKVHSGKKKTLKIPSSVNGHKVSSISSNAFQDMELKELIIPEGITALKVLAFVGSEINTLSLPASLTSIDNNAFGGLRTTQIVVSPKNPSLAVKNKCLINENTGFLYCYTKNSDDTSLIMPEETKRVSDTFSVGANIRTIVLSPNLTHFDFQRFDGIKFIIPVNMTKLPVTLVNFLSDDKYNRIKYLRNIEIEDGNERFSITDSMFVDHAERELLAIIPGDSGKDNFIIPNDVVSIGSCAAVDCKDVRNVLLPQSLKTIGKEAFKGCENLESINIPEGVEKIGTSAFESCTKLKYISIPSSVSFFGLDIFKGTKDLIVSVVENSYAHQKLMKTSNIVLISAKDHRRLNSIGADHVSTEQTGSQSNSDSSNFTYILQDDGTVLIEKYTGTEKACSIPEEIDGKRVKGIDDGAFSGRASLISVTIPDSIIEVGSNPFERCTQLKEITVSIDNDALAAIDGVLFSKADKRLISFPMASEKSTYAVPQGIKILGDYAFYDCDGLKSIDIPGSVMCIGKGAFSSCSKLVSVTIPNGVTEINDYAFFGCRSLTTVNIPDSVTSIDVSTFKECSGLKTLTIPNSVTSIGSNAFSGCYSLCSISIPDSVIHIGEYAFYNCNGLTSIMIPDNVLSIGNGVFSGCSNLTAIRIPDNMIEVGSNPFIGCSKLKDIIISPDHDALAVIDGALFSKVDKRLIAALPNTFVTTTYTIPQGTWVIGACAFSGCRGLKSITIPDSVMHIGKNAFADCADLTCTVGRNSYAKKYCEMNGIKYIYADANNWLND